MRGRDIKRYSYDWADLWLIATFPSRHYNIDDYSSVKNFLLSFGMERLEQTGTTHIINGQKVQSRKKTNNKWFEVQDSISYWEDFDKPKIVWTPVNSEYRFAVIPEKFIFNNSLFMITGTQYLNFMCCVLNSNVLQLYFSFFTRDNYQYGSGDFFEKIPIPTPTKETDEKFSQWITDTKKINLINNEIYSLYGLTAEEIKYIENI